MSGVFADTSPQASLPPTSLPQGQLPHLERQTRVAQFGMFVFLASDLMLFSAFFAAYYLLRSSNQPWPPSGTELETLRPLIGTVVLIASSFTVIAAERRAGAGDASAFRRWLLATIALGLTFLVLQIIDYATVSFTISSDVYGSAFWGLTGLHTAHVIAGVSALGFLYLRSMRAGPPHNASSWTVAITPFWHLVDIVWVGVFTTIWVVR